MRQANTQSPVSRDSPQEVLPAPSAAMAAYLWSRTGRLKEILDVVRAARAWPGVAIRVDRAGLCLTLDGVKLAHLQWNGRIDVPFGPQMRDRLVAEGMASRDFTRPEAQQVVFVLGTKADVDRALWLLRLAYLSVEPSADARMANPAQLHGIRQ